MTARKQCRRIEVGIAAELGDALGDPIGMLLLFLRVLEEFLGGNCRPALPRAE